MCATYVDGGILEFDTFKLLSISDTAKSIGLYSTTVLIGQLQFPRGEDERGDGAGRRVASDWREQELHDGVYLLWDGQRRKIQGNFLTV